MDLKRRVGYRMSVVLLILGNITTAVALSGGNNTIIQNLDCTNDLEGSMVCELEAQNCNEYTLTLRNNVELKEQMHCVFQQCGTGCCCSFTEMMLILGESHTATVWKENKSMGSKIINVSDGIKPRVPTIISVKETNGNFKVTWKTNMDGPLSDSLTANVTYHKKGDTEKVSEYVKPSTVHGLNYHEIHGRHLEPSTTYMVSVRSYTDWSDRYSDSSEEMEFRTPVSYDAILLAVAISLTVVAVIISGAIYYSYVKLKSLLWDTVAKCENPKLLDIHSHEQEQILKPAPLILSTVCIEPLIPDDSKPWLKGSLRDTSGGSLQQSSGISTGSSCLSYANAEPADIIAGVQDALCKAFPNISPISPLTTNTLTESSKDSGLLSSSYNLCGVRAEDTSGSSGFVNRTYSILIPNLPHQVATDSCEVQMQGEILCESAYHPSEGSVVICADQQVPTCPLFTLPPVFPSPVSTDMSYQQCSADSGRFSCAEDPNMMVSYDPVPRVEAGCESSDDMVSGAIKLNGKTEEALICDENPCYGCLPAGSHSFPPVDNDYQAFQNLVEQPDSLFSEKTTGEEEEHLDKYPEESFTKMPPSSSPIIPGFINSFQGDQCLSDLQRPVLSLTPAGQSMAIITDSGYQSV